MRGSTTEVDKQFVAKIKKEYSPVPINETERTIEGIRVLLSFSQEKAKTRKEIIDQLARTIYRLFNFKEVAIILKSEKDGLYRYESLIGYRKEAEIANKSLQFTEDEVEDSDKFPHIKMGRISEFHMAENLEFNGLKDAYNRPLVLSTKRESYDSLLEGDYIDVDIRSINNKLIGWIELGNTRDNKLPTRQIIYWVELIAGIVGVILQKTEMAQKAKFD